MSKTSQYAAETGVPIGRRREQIESELRRLGATRRATLDDDEHGQAVVMFERQGVRYRIILPLPDPHTDAYRYTPARGLMRSPAQQREAWEQDCRARWAALAEYIKTIRIGYEAGIIRIEEALLAHVQLPNGQTVAEHVLPQLPDAYASGEMPAMLPGVSSAVSGAGQPLRMLRAGGGE